MPDMTARVLLIRLAEEWVEDSAGAEEEMYQPIMETGGDIIPSTEVDLCRQIHSIRTVGMVEEDGDAAEVAAEDQDGKNKKNNINHKINGGELCHEVTEQDLQEWVR